LDLSSQGLSLQRCKDRLNKPVTGGYRDILLNFGCKGFIGELQLTLQRLWDCKELAHRTHEIQRVLAA